MLTHKSYRFRVYPTPEQERRLLQWEASLRFLWNLAHEQRLMGLARTDKRYTNTFAQQVELTALRAELPWLADVPRGVCAQTLTELDKAWRRLFGKAAGMPRWKKRGDTIGLIVNDPAKFKLSGGRLTFPKLGALRIVMHREAVGKQKLCSIRRDGDQWFVSVLCAVERPAPEPRTAPVVAIDRGVIYTLADSDGNLTKNPKNYEAALRQLARAQRAVARKKKGSNNRKKAKHRVMRVHQKVRRQREHFLHVESARLAKSHGIVVLEKLYVAGMMRRLGGSIASAGWSTFATMLRYKLAATGGTLVEVPAAYSSQTCSACGCVDERSRDHERFHCTTCGRMVHADTNAAMVLLQRFKAPGSPWCQLAEASPSGSRRSKKQSRVTKRAVEVSL